LYNVSGVRTELRGEPVAYDEELDARLEQMAVAWGATRKKMFGGTCYLLGGHMLAGVYRESLIVRLGRDAGAEALERPGVRPFDITGSPMAGWVMVDADALDDAALEDWLEQAREFVVTLPAK
jgi:TfoX/Sxy family transcriptional regulator of competence genes